MADHHATRVVTLRSSARAAAMVLAILSPTAAVAQASAPNVADTAENAVTIDVGGAAVIVSGAGAFALPHDALLAWVRRSAEVVAGYYGRYPVASARIALVPVGGRGVKTGKAFGHRGAVLSVMIGVESDAADLKRDWVMVHEMVHLALPRMRRRHDWLSEGLAVYVESIARMRMGDLDRKAVWREFVERMPHGLPKAGDRGLDNTPTWGRTYWGGAIFALIADVEIHERTGGRKGLRDALRGIQAAGGDFEQFWPIERIIAEADAATGTTVIAELYEAWRAKPVDPDLPGLWQALGIAVDGADIRFNEAARWAVIRRSIEGDGVTSEGRGG